MTHQSSPSEQYAAEALEATRRSLLEYKGLASVRFDAIELVGEPPESRIRVDWAVPAFGSAGTEEYAIFDDEWHGGGRSAAKVAMLITVDIEEHPHPDPHPQ